MKKIFLILCIISCHFADAQNKKTTLIEQQLESFRLALISGDSLALDALVAADLSYGHSSGLVETKAQFIRKLVSGQSDFVDATFDNQTIKISGNVAIVRHQLRANINDSGVAGKIDLFVLLVWKKEQKNWRLLARQAIRKPA